MSIKTYHLRAATDQDVSAVVGLRLDAERWLASAGIEQWTVSSTGEKNIRAHIERQATIVVEDNMENIVASLTLDGGDPVFWTVDELRDRATYLYKFIIGPGHRGAGLGDALLNWACERSASTGAEALRLDCWRTNTRLHEYYLRRGFRYLTTRTAPGRMSGALFERPTNLLLPVSAEVQLVDTTGGVKVADKYDPTGEAAVWLEAAEILDRLKIPGGFPGDENDHWNTALEQGARALDTRAREIRQAGGMYYRPLTGETTD